jgi:hypothetical protein
MNAPTVLVFFTGGSGLTGRWTRRLTRSEFGHVAIGIGDVVLNPTRDGDVLTSLDVYLGWVPKLRCWFFVPLRRPFPPREPDETDRSYLPSLVRCLTGGRWPRTRDCVSVVAGILRDGGIPVPPRTCTPRGLHHWLLSQGFEHEQTKAAGEVPAPGAGSAHPEP